jgi:hypothetical protein
MGKFNEAEEVHKQLHGSTSGHDLISRAKLHNQTGIIMAEKDDQNTALLHLEKALNIREELLPLNHPDLAISYNNLFYLVIISNEPAYTVTSVRYIIKWDR